MIQVPWHFYQHYPADYSAGAKAARGFRGWTSEVRELDLGRTALMLMHLPDVGLTPDTEWRPDCQRPDLLGTVEWIPRTMDLCTRRLPKLVTAARHAGWQVVHLRTHVEPWFKEHAARSLAEAGTPPPADADRIQTPGKSPHTRDVFGELPGRPPGSPEHPLGLPEALRPQGNDLVATQSWQLHRLMQKRGITHLIYTGWALNWCLWFSYCGMSDMQRKGYLCSAVRGGCVAIENRDSADTEANLEYGYWKTSTMFGYIFDLDELTAVLTSRPADEK